MTIEDDLRNELVALEALLEEEQAADSKIKAERLQKVEREMEEDRQITDRLFEALSSLVSDGTIRMSEEPHFQWGVAKIITRKGFPGFFGIGRVPEEYELVFKKGQRLGDFCPAIIKRVNDCRIELYYNGKSPMDGDRPNQFTFEAALENEAYWYDDRLRLMVTVTHKLIQFRVWEKPTGQPLDAWFCAYESNFGKKLIELLEYVRKNRDKKVIY